MDGSRCFQTPKGVDYTLTAVSIKKNRPNSTNQRRQSLKVEFSLFHPVPNPAHTISCSPPHPFKLTPNLTPFHAMDVMISHPPYSTFYTAQTSRGASHPPHPKDVEFRVTTRFPSKSRHTNPHSTPPHFGDKVENLVSSSKPYFPNVPHITTDEDYNLKRNRHL